MTCRVMHSVRVVVAVAVTTLLPIRISGDRLEFVEAACEENSSCCKEIDSACVKCAEACIVVDHAYDRGQGRCGPSPDPQT